MSSKTPTSDIQGEGNYEAARRFNKSEKRFVDQGKVAKAADKTAPKSKEEADALEHAEEEASLHSKGEDATLVADLQKDARKQLPKNK